MKWKCQRCGRPIETIDDLGGIDDTKKIVCVKCLQQDLLNMFDLFVDPPQELIDFVKGKE